MNSIHNNPHINFTMEEEADRSVPFLDTRVIRTPDDKIILDWYQKTIHSGRYVNYLSYHNVKMKTNVILGLRKRIETITHPSLVLDAKRRLEKILLDNGYPRALLGKLLYNAINDRSQQLRIDHNTTLTDTNEEPCRTAPLPYIEGLTHKIIHIFKPIRNIKIAQYNLITNRCNFTNLKDKIQQGCQSGLVYLIPCNNCDSVYIGQTAQHLDKRITLHKSDARIRPQRCALANHANSKHHDINYQEVKILEFERNPFTRSFLEMCHISTTSNTMNSKTDLNNLSTFYKYLLYLEKNRYQGNPETR